MCFDFSAVDSGGAMPPGDEKHELSVEGVRAPGYSPKVALYIYIIVLLR